MEADKWDTDAKMGVVAQRVLDRDDPLDVLQLEQRPRDPSRPCSTNEADLSTHRPSKALWPNAPANGSTTTASCNLSTPHSRTRSRAASSLTSVGRLAMAETPRSASSRKSSVWGTPAGSATGFGGFGFFGAFWRTLAGPRDCWAGVRSETRRDEQLQNERSRGRRTLIVWSGADQSSAVRRRQS